MLYPRGANENKVNAFSSYYARWKGGHQPCRETERQEIQTASDMRVAMQYREICLVCSLVMTSKAWRNNSVSMLCAHEQTGLHQYAPVGTSSGRSECCIALVALNSW